VTRNEHLFFSVGTDRPAGRLAAALNRPATTRSLHWAGCELGPRLPIVRCRDFSSSKCSSACAVSPRARVSNTWRLAFSLSPARGSMGYQPPLPRRPARFARGCGWRHTNIRTPPPGPPGCTLRRSLSESGCTVLPTPSDPAVPAASLFTGTRRHGVVAVGFTQHQQHRPDHAAQTLRPRSWLGRKRGPVTF